MFKNKTILITGGTGSFGKSCLKFILQNMKNIKKIIVFSRDELKQHEMKNEIKSNKVRYFLGDIRDLDRLNFAFREVDFVIHAAALKQVDTAEYNPYEFVKTNIIGAQNIIQASISNNVNKVIALSTDKAVAPANLYGATKLCSDKLFIAANNILGKQNLSFSIVRYGNVFGSRGSVVPVFLEQIKKNRLTVTNKNMTRFNILMKESIDMVLYALQYCKGGEILVPKLKSYRLLDLVKAIKNKHTNIIYTETRPGEKIHEDLILNNSSTNCFDIGKYYILLETNNERVNNFYKKNKKFKILPSNFVYNSGSNKEFLNINEIKNILDNYVKSLKN